MAKRTAEACIIARENMHKRRVGELLVLAGENIVAMREMFDEAHASLYEVDEQSTTNACDEKIPDEFMRAVYIHKNYLTKTWKLPRPLPANLDESFSFLTKDGYKTWGNQQLPETGKERAFYYGHNLKDDFDTLATDAFGPTVVGACGIVHTVMVPTYDE